MLFEAPGFGKIVFRGRDFGEDIVVCRDEVFPRAKELSSDRRSVYGHTPLTLREVNEYIRRCGDVEEVVIAAGYYGDLPIEPDALSRLLKVGRRVVVVKTGDLPSLELDLSRALVIVHVTC